MTASDINYEISFWAHLGGIFLIATFEVETPTWHVGSIFQWQHKSNEVPGKNLALASLPSHHILLVSSSILSLLLPCSPWRHQNPVPSGFQHEVKTAALRESTSSCWEYWGIQTHGVSCYLVLLFIVSRAIVGLPRLYQASQTSESLFNVCLFYQFCSSMVQASIDSMTAKQTMKHISSIQHNLNDYTQVKEAEEVSLLCTIFLSGKCNGIRGEKFATRIPLW